MKLKVLGFASVTSVWGTHEIEIEDLEDGASVGDLKQLLEERYPKLRGLWDRMAVAVDGRVVPDHSVLEHGNEVALLPPVSGG